MKNKYLYPLKLQSITKSTLWGGSRLSERYNKPNIDKLGECWELSVREKEQNIILNGPCKGLSIGEYLKNYTDLSPESFPILIKLIDARDKLSVQVHPIGKKTEMWHIIEAEDDSSIIFGADNGTSAPELSEGAVNGSIEKHLRKIPVSAGETYFIPAGMVHAIGAGILLAEIQQNSDTTYRFYDYGRGRELHSEQALDNFKNFTDDEITDLQFSKNETPQNGELLTSCEYFTVVKNNITDRQEFSTEGSPFVSLLCIEGSGKIKWQSGSEEVNVGDSFFLPKEIGTFEIYGNLKVLSTTV